MKPMKAFNVFPLLTILIIAIACQTGCRENHYLVYETQKEKFGEITINYRDQFLPDDKPEFTFNKVAYFACPSTKEINDNLEEMLNPKLHYNWYTPDELPNPKIMEVTVENQFSKEPFSFKTSNLEFLLTPSTKAVKKEEGMSIPQLKPPAEAHYTCYKVGPGNFPDLGQISIKSKDQFGKHEFILKDKPRYFCLPCEKYVDGELSPKDYKVDIHRDDHLLFYEVAYDFNLGKEVFSFDQFREAPTPHELKLYNLRFFGVPTTKFHEKKEEKSK